MGGGYSPEGREVEAGPSGRATCCIYTFGKGPCAAQDPCAAVELEVSRTIRNITCRGRSFTLSPLGDNGVPVVFRITPFVLRDQISDGTVLPRSLCFDGENKKSHSPRLLIVREKISCDGRSRGASSRVTRSFAG